MKIALLGLTQAGKKTLFTLLTGREIPAGLKPGEALEGIAPIQDSRVDRLAEIFTPERTVYAENNYMLCPDVVEGAGSNDWMSSASGSDLVCMVLDSFSAPADPERDRETIEAELFLADMQLIEKRLGRIEKEKRAGMTQSQALEEDVLKRCMESLDSGTAVRDMGLSVREFGAIKSLQLLTAIPVLSVYNVSEEALGDEGDQDGLRVSCSIEKDIMEIEEPGERDEFLASLGISSSGLARVNSAAYEALGLMSFYTVGKDECRAWTIRKGATAPEAAGKIHTDIQRGFIRVEVIKYDDLVSAGSEQKAKEQGKVRTLGKDYILEDGDVCHFLFNV